MKAIAIIPARGGSKRIPRKNVKDFLGMPIIAYSIKAALLSGVFDEVMVSTDDEEIAAVAREYGAVVPFFRSAETSNDFASTADVILEVLGKYAEIDVHFDIVACIYATAPFLSVETIKKGMDAIKQNGYDSAFTCVEFSYPILRSMIIDKNNRISMKWPEYQLSRSQDLEKFYHDAGQYYVSKTDNYIEHKAFCGNNTAPLILSELSVQDLDTETDWKIAEIKYKLINRL